MKLHNSENAITKFSQNNFFTWLLEWADNDKSQHNQQINETAKDFIRILLGKSSEFQINKVEVNRQWGFFDIRAEINDEYSIRIENKTNNSKQLEGFKDILTKFANHKKHKLVFVYLNTENESLTSLKKIAEKGYLTVDRKTILSVLNNRPITDEKFNTFNYNLIAYENTTNSYTKLENITSEIIAGEGFFMALQDRLQVGDWQFVTNITGGFLGFWYYKKNINEIGKIYIQIENAFENGIKLVIKIALRQRNLATHHKIHNDIKQLGEKNGLSITKPNFFKLSSISTLAIVQNAFIVDGNGIFDLNQFIVTLKKLEQTLDEY